MSVMQVWFRREGKKYYEFRGHKPKTIYFTAVWGTRVKKYINICLFSPAFQKPPFFFSLSWHLPSMFYLHLSLPHPSTLLPANTDPFNSPIPSFFGFRTLSPPLSLSFLHFCLSLPLLRRTNTHTHAHKALILSLCGFSFKTESSQRKKLTPPPLLCAAGKLQPSSMPHPPFSLTHTHLHTRYRVKRSQATPWQPIRGGEEKRRRERNQRISVLPCKFTDK